MITTSFRRTARWLPVALMATAAVGADAPVQPASVPWIERVRRAREALEWTDEIVRHDWRLQRHAGDDSYRIVDPDERVVRRGSAAECRDAFRTLEQEGTVPALRGPTTILLHGLGEGRDSMRFMLTPWRANGLSTL